MEMNSVNNYPENYILVGAAAAEADGLISQIKASRPEQFEGNRDAFSFELRYTVPFDKDFYELKRLQGTAAEAAGRRNEFKGYIIIDVNNWLTHHEEEYLNKALLFLIDMSDCWKYIFLVKDLNSKAARELVGKILSVFICNHISCKVKEEKEKNTCESRVNALCKEQGVICSPAVKELLRELLDQEFNESIVLALLSEMSWNDSKKNSMEAIANFINDRESVVRYMLSQREYDRLLAIIEKRKEHLYGEKEAV